jgi:hypothetical protein
MLSKIPRRKKHLRVVPQKLAALSEKEREHKTPEKNKARAEAGGYKPYKFKRFFIKPCMLEPIANSTAAYVPLCAALHWIMTDGGTRKIAIDNKGAWNSAVDKLLPLMSGGEIELIGLRCGRPLPEPLPATTLALIRVSPPILPNSISDFLIDSPSHIECCSFVTQEFWFSQGNDRLYESGRASPAWTHLQVRKRDLLKRWPKPGPKANAEHACREWLVEQMQKSLDARPKQKSAFWDEAKGKWPALGKRQFERAWHDTIELTGAHNWSRAGAPKRAGRRSATDEI